MEGTFYSQSNLFALIFQIFAFSVALITGVILSAKLMKQDDQKTKWRGRFLLIAFISFVVSALTDAAILVNPIMLVFMRLLLMSSAIEYYLAFFLPDRLANWLIKESNK